MSLCPTPQDATRQKVLGCVLLLWFGLAGASGHAAQSAGGGKDNAATEPAAPSKTVTFKLSVMMDGTSDSGRPTHTDQFTASDGELVDVFSMKLRSVADAAAEAQGRVKQASRTIERKRRVDKDGAVLGEEILLAFGVKDSKDAAFVLVWTKGRVYVDISSKSLDDVRAMKKYMKLD